MNDVKPVLVERLIALDFQDNCNLCFTVIKQGEEAFWYGKGFGVRHYSCYMKRSTLLSNKEFDELSKW